MLSTLVPPDLDERVYREPFLGAGSLFFALRPAHAAVSDLNAGLIRMYEHVRQAPHQVARYLRVHARLHSSEHYYQVRNAFNECKRHSAAQAARFIYLNRACFNGIYRVNLQGMFNVPYGYNTHPVIPNFEHVSAIAAALKGTRLRSCSFEHACEDVSKGDFLYLDPPYPALNGTSFFSHYTANRFDYTDHTRVADVVHALDKAGCLVLMSNADTRRIRRLYKNFNMVSIAATRYVTSHSVKHRVSELIITNYDASERRSETK